MRIWIAPFEDSDGDLQVGGFVFTELEARRWLIGQPGEKGHPPLRPLQVSSRKEAPQETFAVKAETTPMKSPEPVGSGLQVEEPTYD
jgi:conjugal transfer pilus assembly protein TraV